MIFGWRKRQIADSVDKDINEVPKVKPKVAEFDNRDAEYTVGINQAGHTQLRVKLDYGSATLTMQPGAVKQLIRQLEATLEDEPND